MEGSYKTCECLAESVVNSSREVVYVVDTSMILLDEEAPQRYITLGNRVIIPGCVMAELNGIMNNNTTEKGTLPIVAAYNYRMIHQLASDGYLEIQNYFLDYNQIKNPKLSINDRIIILACQNMKNEGLYPVIFTADVELSREASKRDITVILGKINALRYVYDVMFENSKKAELEASKKKNTKKEKGIQFPVDEFERTTIWRSKDVGKTPILIDDENYAYIVFSPSGKNKPAENFGNIRGYKVKNKDTVFIIKSDRAVRVCIMIASLILNENAVIIADGTYTETREIEGIKELDESKVAVIRNKLINLEMKGFFKK